jgi:hypothetical protein
MSAQCSEVLSPAPDTTGVKTLRILERVDGFFLQRLDERGELQRATQHDTMDEAMLYAYSEYEAISDWRRCSEH